MNDRFISGIDVSHYQGTIDWQKVAASGIAFAYAKATEGAATKDSRFTTNYNGMKSNGILRGAYHFFHPATDAKAQAENFMSVVQQLDLGDLPPSLDIEIDEEKSETEIIGGIREWIDTVETQLGRKPIIYTGASFWNEKVGGSGDFSDCLLWVAHYTSKPAPTIPKGFDDFTFWQYSNQGRVDGITDNTVDLDRFKGNMHHLKKLAGF